MLVASRIAKIKFLENLKFFTVVTIKVPWSIWIILILDLSLNFGVFSVSLIFEYFQEKIITEKIFDPNHIISYESKIHKNKNV